MVFKEILPNLRGSIIVMATLAVPGYIGTEAGLSFLGVGVAPPTPSWGQMIASAVSWYAVDPMYFADPRHLPVPDRAVLHRARRPDPGRPDAGEAA